MSHVRSSIPIAAASLAMAAPGAALAKTITVGNANGAPTTNVCMSGVKCTYMNYKRGKPADVVKRSGTLVAWKLNAGSTGGKVQLRVLRPTAKGKFKVVKSSAIRTVTTAGINTFSAHIKVKRGDVLALSNSSSGIFMANGNGADSLRYFDKPLSDGMTGKPNKSTPQLRVLLSAVIHV